MAMSNHLEETLLSKRGCVSDCVVPSCSSISCASTETCILSSQTCSACPAVSCVSLSLTVTDTTTDSDVVPKGAIAGIVIAGLLLLCGISFLAWHIQKRRRVIREINEKADLMDEDPDLEENNSEFEDVSYSRISRSDSKVASIQIALDEDLKLSSGLNSPLPAPDHFFSADELLRMSYADSVSSRATSIRIATKSMNEDTDAAIMQANNPVLAVRTKASVLKIQKVPFPNADAVRRSGAFELALQHGSNATGQALGSFWENDSDSVLNSPIQTEFISPHTFKDSPARNTPAGGSPTPTKPRLGRSLTGDVPGSSVASNARSVSDNVVISFAEVGAIGRTTSLSSPRRSSATKTSASPQASDSEAFDWQDPTKHDFS